MRDLSRRGGSEISMQELGLCVRSYGREQQDTSKSSFQLTVSLPISPSPNKCIHAMWHSHRSFSACLCNSRPGSYFLQDHLAHVAEAAPTASFGSLRSTFLPCALAVASQAIEAQNVGGEEDSERTASWPTEI